MVAGHASGVKALHPMRWFDYDVVLLVVVSFSI